MQEFLFATYWFSFKKNEKQSFRITFAFEYLPFQISSLQSEHSFEVHKYKIFHSCIERNRYGGQNLALGLISIFLQGALLTRWVGLREEIIL